MGSSILAILQELVKHLQKNIFSPKEYCGSRNSYFYFSQILLFKKIIEKGTECRIMYKNKLAKLYTYKSTLA
jgi:hypothetical protein